MNFAPTRKAFCAYAKGLSGVRETTFERTIVAVCLYYCRSLPLLLSQFPLAIVTVSPCYRFSLMKVVHKKLEQKNGKEFDCLEINVYFCMQLRLNINLL